MVTRWFYVASLVGQLCWHRTHSAMISLNIWRLEMRLAAIERRLMR